MCEGKILMISDDMAVLEQLAIVLSGEDCAALSASSCDEGLEVFNNVQAHLVIIDARCQVRVNELETLRRIKEIRPATQVIMLAGHATIENAVEAMRMGAYNYLVKPPILSELIASVERALTAKAKGCEKEL